MFQHFFLGKSGVQIEQEKETNEGPINYKIFLLYHLCVYSTRQASTLFIKTQYQYLKVKDGLQIAKLLRALLSIQK